MSRHGLTAALIGVGHWGPNLLRNLVRHPRLKLRYACDRDKSAMENVGDLIPPDCARVADAREVFRDKSVDAVVLATPATTHYALARAALKAGKHVLCEKPLALKVAEAEELCALADARGLKLFVDYTFLFNNSVLTMKSIVDEGKLGQIYYATATRTHLGLVREDVNVLWDLASHDVAILNFLLGSTPVRVSAVGGRPLGLRREDVAFATLFYPGGVIANVHVSWVDSNKERKVVLVGSNARVAFNDLDNAEPVRLFHKGINISDRVEPDFGNFRLLLRDGDIISPRVEQREPLNNMLDAFVRCVLDGAPNIADGRFAADVTRVLTAAEASLAVGGAPRKVV